MRRSPSGSGCATATPTRPATTNMRAEDFFFAHCQGKVGDADCAMLIAGHYKAKKDAVALDAFAGKVSLRYDSDTQKVKSLTK